MSTAIKASNIVKQYSDLYALNGFTIDVSYGECVGLIGPNGAGKTTALRILTTLETPTGGELIINGADAVTDPSPLRKQIGWMPDAFVAPDGIRVEEYLMFFARINGLNSDLVVKQFNRVVNFAKLSDILDRQVAELSKGMKQRVSLARMLINDPKILVLDEPAAGLDPKSRVELRRLLQALAAEGKAIIISSHILSELEELCDSFVMLADGKVMFSGSASQLKTSSSLSQLIQFTVIDRVQELSDFLTLLPNVEIERVLRNGIIIKLDLENGEDFEKLLAEINASVFREGFLVVEIRLLTKNLEDVFVEMVS